MDAVQNAFSGSSDNTQSTQTTSAEQTTPSSGGWSDKLNSALGGGAASEKNEDFLDKSIDYVQQYALGQGAQNNESAAEQAQDEMISDAIRGQYKTQFGSDFPVADK